MKKVKKIEMVSGESARQNNEWWNSINLVRGFRFFVQSENSCCDFVYEKYSFPVYCADMLINTDYLTNDTFH